MGREFEPHRGHKRNRQKSIPLFLQTCIARDLQSAVRSRPRSFTQVNSLRPLTPSLRISRTLQVCFQNCIVRDLAHRLRFRPRSRTQVRSCRLRLAAALSRALFNFEKALLNSNAVLSNLPRPRRLTHSSILKKPC